MKVLLDKKLCSGHARCIEMAPEVYAADEMGFCVLKHQHLPEHLEEEAHLGAANCPEGALTIVADEVSSESPPA